MDDWRGNAAKARLVWKAARIPNVGPLGYKAAQLGNELGWAETWFATDRVVTSPKQKHKTDEAAHLEEILRHTRALRGLMEADNRAVLRLERFYPNPFQCGGPPNFSEMVRGLAAIEQAAMEALAERRKVNPIGSKPGISPLDRYVFALAKAYEEYSRRPARVSTIGGKKGGPFVRFVEEASRQFGAQCPSAETIAAALRKRSTAEADWHVITMVKKQSE